MPEIESNYIKAVRENLEISTGFRRQSLQVNISMAEHVLSTLPILLNRAIAELMVEYGVRRDKAVLLIQALERHKDVKIVEGEGGEETLEQF